MKKEAKLLKHKAIASLKLSVDHFNRLDDIGRTEVVLILLDHSFEMLLKGSILYRGGKIRESGTPNTIGFDACVRRALTQDSVKFINSNQALVLQTINQLRDAAQHHLLSLSEGRLYIHTQSGVTLFRDLLKEVFDEDLVSHLPDRALPVSTIAPLDPITVFEEELNEVKALLAPGRRKRTEADAKLRGLAIVDGALQGEKDQPGERSLQNLRDQITAGRNFNELFPGLSAVSFTAGDTGTNFNLRITKKEGVPVHLVKEGTPGATVVGVKRVDDLSFYSLGRDQLAKKVGLTPAKTTAAIRLLNLQGNSDCHKEIVVGKTRFNRYSQQAITEIRDLMKSKSPDEIWNEYKLMNKRVGGSNSA